MTQALSIIFSRWGLISALALALLVVDNGLPFGLFKGRADWQRLAGQRAVALTKAGDSLRIASRDLLTAGAQIQAVVVQHNAAVKSLQEAAAARTRAAEAAQAAAAGQARRWRSIAQDERQRAQALLARSVPILPAEQRIAALEAQNSAFVAAITKGGEK